MANSAKFCPGLCCIIYTHYHLRIKKIENAKTHKIHLLLRRLVSDDLCIIVLLGSALACSSKRGVGQLLCIFKFSAVDIISEMPVRTDRHNCVKYANMARQLSSMLNGIKIIFTGLLT